jgi:hypothetical protein
MKKLRLPHRKSNLTTGNPIPVKFKNHLSNVGKSVAWGDSNARLTGHKYITGKVGDHLAPPDQTRKPDPLKDTRS